MDVASCADVEAAREGLPGDTDSARQAQSDGIGRIENGAGGVQSAIETFVNATDRVAPIETAFALMAETEDDPFWRDVWEYIHDIISILFEIVDIVLDAFSAGIGIGQLHRMGRQHHTTIEAIVQGEPLE